MTSSGIKPRPMTPSRFSGANQPHSLLPPGAPPSSAKKGNGTGKGTREEKGDSGSIKSPAAHHEFVEGGAGYNVLNTAKEEIRALTEALKAKTEMLEEARSAYDMLVLQLQEDGSTLKKKDRERYRQVLAELKDYEIYKNVMESALTKMQKEMEELLSENQSLKAKLSNRENDVKRRETYREQYAKDLTNTRKLLRDSTDKVEELEEKNKKLIKTGEELRTNFNAMRQDRNDMKKELEVQREQTMRLKEKVATMEAREVERRKEEEKKKAAHRGALEDIHSYQEENDLLKSALAELLEDSDKNHQKSSAVSPPERQSNSQSGPSVGSTKKVGYRGSIVFNSQQHGKEQQSVSVEAPQRLSTQKSMSTLFNISETGKSWVDSKPPPPSASKSGAAFARNRKNSILS